MSVKPTNCRYVGSLETISNIVKQYARLSDARISYDYKLEQIVKSLVWSSSHYFDIDIYLLI